MKTLKDSFKLIKKFYCISYRIYTVLRAIKQTQASVHKVRRSIEDKLLSSQETTRKRAEHEDLLLKREQLCAEVTWRTASVNKMKDQADQLHRSNQEQGGVLWHALVLPLEFAKNSIIFFYMYHSFVGFSNIHNMLFSKDMIFVFYTFEVYTVLWKKCKLNLCYPIDLYKIDMTCFGIIVCLFFVLYFFIQKFPIFITRNSNEKE